MNLNLKVAHKVYLGFGIIVVLLIVSGLTSMGKLSTIIESTVQVTDIAVPVQKQSNQLQIKQLKQAKLSAMSFNTNSIATIETRIEQFAAATAELNQNYQTPPKVAHASRGGAGRALRLRHSRRPLCERASYLRPHLA